MEKKKRRTHSKYKRSHLGTERTHFQKEMTPSLRGRRNYNLKHGLQIQ
jgi:hypothetical protein